MWVGSASYASPRRSCRRYGSGRSGRWSNNSSERQRTASAETQMAIDFSRSTTGPVGDRARIDSDYVFHELTRSICPNCRRVIDAKILLRDNKVYMSKRCPQCGTFMSLVYAAAEGHVSSSHNTKPGTIPPAHGPAAHTRCPHHCGR